jgi:hypothetical protein
MGSDSSNRRGDAAEGLASDKQSLISEPLRVSGWATWDWEIEDHKRYRGLSKRIRRISYSPNIYDRRKFSGLIKCI